MSCICVCLCLSALAGWLVTQAVRLRAYLQFILLKSATAVDGWALPPGLLEPFPADVLLSGVSIFADQHIKWAGHWINWGWDGVEVSG